MRRNFQPQILSLEDRVVLSDGLESMEPGSLVVPPDYEVTMDPQPYTYSQWYDAFKNFFNNIDDLVVDYISPPDSYIWDGYSSPYFIQP